MAIQNVNQAPLPDQQSQSHPENMLFPRGDGKVPSNISMDFIVEDAPIVLKAFNLQQGDELIIEMKGIINCKEVYAPYWYCNCAEILKHPKTVHFVEVPGTYRLIYVNSQNSTAHFDEILVTKTIAAQREHAHKPTAGCGNC